ncbi:hypothetical protein LCGC14_0016020 [marine sediment metagenome]|uniref:Sulfatase N-terminal domain-containing protein n=1 Tax=marine sediment metagenome TaxID=412755 RepID=A0A0F9W1D1_9ZZZZ|nr:LTA synthase family protein [Phycisphaerae bacterium]HDZ44072.1 LTA synthase family protein [Phycisphaerae bacterium]
MLVSQRIRPFWITAGTLLVIFAIFRVILLVATRDTLVSVTAGQIVRCFLVGMRYDGVAVGYIMIPLAAIVTLAPNLAFGLRWFRRALTVMAAAAATVVLLVEIGGGFFFLQFGSRLNWLAMDYFGHFEEIAKYIWQMYPVWAMPIVAIVAGWGFYRLFRWSFWIGDRPSGPIWPRPILATAVIALCVISARGSLGHHRLRFGAAYFCTNKTVCHLAMNNFFTLGEAYKSQMHDRRDLTDDYPMPPVETAWRITRDMLAQDADTFLNRPGNPLWRRTDTGRPMQDTNVVIIVMEGMAGRPVGVLGHGESQTPNLDALCEQGVFFSRMYAVGDRTCRGLIGIMSGHPDLEARSIMKRSRSQGNFLTLAQILQRRGYETMFIFGGNPDFDNMKGFFGAGGVERFIDHEQMDPNEPANVWGTHDEGIFKKVNETFVAMGDKKFFAIIKTVSNHEPYDVPAGRTELLPTDTEINRRLNAYRYADWALAEFFKQAAKEPYFERTLFVLVPDQERTQNAGDILDVLGFHVPCLFYAPGLVPARRITSVASHTDIAPTILSLLGGSYEHCFLGRNMLAVDDDGFAFFRNDKRVALVVGDRALVQAPGRDAFLVRTGRKGLEDIPADQIAADEIEQQRLRMLSYYQASRELYFNDTYNLPPAKEQIGPVARQGSPGDPPADR